MTTHKPRPEQPSTSSDAWLDERLKVRGHRCGRPEYETLLTSILGGLLEEHRVQAAEAVAATSAAAAEDAEAKVKAEHALAEEQAAAGSPRRATRRSGRATRGRSGPATGKRRLRA